MPVLAAAAGNNLLKADYGNNPAASAFPVLTAFAESASPAASAVDNLSAVAAVEDACAYVALEC